MLGEYGIWYEDHGLRKPMHIVLKTGYEMGEALDTLPGMPDGFEPERLAEFEIDGTARPFVIVQYNGPDRIVTVSHYFGDDMAYESVIWGLNCCGNDYYFGKWTDFMGGIEIEGCGMNDMNIHIRHGQRVNRAKLFLDKAAQ